MRGDRCRQEVLLQTDLAAERVLTFEIHVGESLVDDDSASPGASSAGVNARPRRMGIFSVSKHLRPHAYHTNQRGSRVRIGATIDRQVEASSAGKGKLLAVVTASSAPIPARRSLSARAKAFRSFAVGY